MTPSTGLVIGRFDPPHLGHSYLIEWAAARCERLVVFVNTRTDGQGRDVAPGELRAAWLAELHPDVTVVQVGHALDTDWHDEELWPRWIALFRDHWPLERGPDVVFSSDPYVAELARRLGADAVVVDAERRTVPISATQVRADPGAHLDASPRPCGRGSRPTGSDQLPPGGQLPGWGTIRR